MDYHSGHWEGRRLPPLEEEPSSPEQETKRLIPENNGDASTPVRNRLELDEQSDPPSRSRMAVLHHGRAAMGHWEQSSGCIGGSRNRKAGVKALKECSIIGIAGNDAKLDSNQTFSNECEWDPSSCTQVHCVSCVDNGTFTRMNLSDVASVRMKKKRMELERKDGSSIWLYDVDPQRAAVIRESILSCHIHSRVKPSARHSAPEKANDWEPANDSAPGPLSTLQESFHSPQSSDPSSDPTNSDHEDDTPATIQSPPSPLPAAQRLTTRELLLAELSPVVPDLSTATAGERQRSDPFVPLLDLADFQVTEDSASQQSTSITVEGLQADAALVWQTPSKQAPFPLGNQLDESMRGKKQPDGIAKQWRTLTTQGSPPERLQHAVTHSSQNTMQPNSFGFTDMQIKEVIAVAQRLQHEPLSNISSPPGPSVAASAPWRPRPARRESAAGSTEMQRALDEFDRYMDETKTEKAPPGLIHGLMRERGAGVLVPQNHVVLM
mmetsp:Transcript_42971/g.101033  ORF Transcript_42971/g.101033 Transcript_42971/m.101033 type:complete len:494 (-) Transcript_42971:832-2313(-)